MQKQDASFLLKQKIREKEIELAEEGFLLREQMKMTMESLKPMNLIKDALTSSEMKTGLTDAAIGLSSGYLIKKAVVRSSRNPLLKLLGTLVGIGVTNVMTKHPEGVKAIGGKIMDKLFKREEEGK